MRSISKIRVHDEKDWKEADRVGRILIHVCQPEVFILTDQDEQYYEKIRMTARILNQYYSEATVDKVMKETFDTMSHRSRLQLKQDTDRFYGSFDKESKKLNWIRQKERLLTLLEKLHLKMAPESKPTEDDDLTKVKKAKKASNEIIELIIKVEKQLAELRKEMPDVEDLLPEIPIGPPEFTTDPSVLELINRADSEN